MGINEIATVAMATAIMAIINLTIKNNNNNNDSIIVIIIVTRIIKTCK